MICTYVVDCKTMDFEFPWMSALNFKAHIYSFNDDLVARDWWMIIYLSNELIRTNRRGILVVPEFRYSKSALIPQIACSSDNRSLAFPLYEKISVIHFCMYNVRLSLNPGFFVHSMAGKLSSLYPEFGNVIFTDSTASSYLSVSKCDSDPNRCFDYTILYPLQKTKIGQSNPMIITIGYIDECIKIGPKNILALLREKIYLLPSNIKFLFTSRYDSKTMIYLHPDISVYDSHYFGGSKGIQV